MLRGIRREWTNLKCFLLNRPLPRLKTPLPDNWDEWSPFARDMWHAIDAPRCDEAAITAVMERHAPEVVHNSARSLAGLCGAANEAEMY